ncbi:MAG: DUF3997 domain-containing protein, partial [Muribaculaceae bacterium]|nr:DUF3997 domain-containing protein [Muribaculaceae bacterium]
TMVFDDHTLNLGDDYKCTENPPIHIYGPKITIPPEIIDYRYDKRFIVALQRLNGIKPERNYYDKYDYDYPSLYGDYYWIIDKQEESFYGPLCQQDYINKCDSLGVSLYINTNL